MLHMLLYSLHVAGMAVLISLALWLTVKKDLAPDSLKRISTILMSAAHTQLLTGFALFFLLLSDVNHMKIGIKMLLAIEISILTTIYRKGVMKGEQPKQIWLVSALISALTVTIIAFIL